MKNLYTGLNKRSAALGESNDCSVIAVAAATSSSYEVSWEAHLMSGRRRRKRSSYESTFDALRLLGFEAVRVRHFKARTLVTLERELPKRGVFLVFVRGHVLCARAGRIHDWSAGRRHRIRWVYRVVRSKE